MKLSILIPVFNEEKTISSVLEKISALSIPHARKEIIVINDGSTDATDKKILEFIKYKKDIIYLKHRQNLGKGKAVQTGIKKCSGEYIIVQDADLEYNPADIPRLFKYIQTKTALVVFGTRLNRVPNIKKEEDNPRFFLHYLGNRFLSLMTSLLYGQWITDMETCYKLFPKNAVDSLNLTSKGFEFEPEITVKLLKKGYRIQEVPIVVVPRSYKEGKKLNTLSDGWKALWTLIKFRFKN